MKKIKKVGRKKNSSKLEAGSSKEEKQLEAGSSKEEREIGGRKTIVYLLNR